MLVGKRHGDWALSWPSVLTPHAFCVWLVTPGRQFCWWCRSHLHRHWHHGEHQVSTLTCAVQYCPHVRHYTILLVPSLSVPSPESPLISLTVSSNSHYCWAMLTCALLAGSSCSHPISTLPSRVWAVLLTPSQDSSPRALSESLVPSPLCPLCSALLLAPSHLCRLIYCVSSAPAHLTSRLFCLHHLACDALSNLTLLLVPCYLCPRML